MLSLLVHTLLIHFLFLSVNAYACSALEDACSAVAFFDKQVNSESDRMSSLHTTTELTPKHLLSLLSFAQDKLKECDAHDHNKAIAVAEVQNYLATKKKSFLLMIGFPTNYGGECDRAHLSRANLDILSKSFQRLTLIPQKDPMEGIPAVCRPYSNVGSLDHWARTVVEKKLLSFDSDNTDSDLPMLSFIYPLHPLIQVLAVKRSSQLALLGQMMEPYKDKQLLPPEDWKSWIKTTLNPAGPDLTPEQFKLVVSEAIERAKTAKKGCYRLYPVPLFDIKISHPAFVEANRSKENLENYKNFLYSQIQSSDERGFSYGFPNSNACEKFIKDISNVIKNGIGKYVSANLTSPSKRKVSKNKSHSPQKDKSNDNKTDRDGRPFEISVQIQGSLASGLSFREKGNNIRRLGGNHSDFDVAVTIPQDVFDALRERINKDFLKKRLKGKDKENKDKLRWSKSSGCSPPLDLNEHDFIFQELGLLSGLSKTMAEVQPYRTLTIRIKSPNCQK